MAQHTPGPWAIDQNYGSGCLHVWSPRREIAVARVSDDHPRAEDYANARLIAAAPDLLAALQQALAWSEEERRWAETADLSKWIERSAALEAAIAKATYTPA